jgi:hypothetical protein
MPHKIDLLSTENLTLIAANVILERIPMRTSSLSRAAYLHEVLLSKKNPRRCFEVLRLPKETFTALCHWHWTRSKCLLADTRRVSVEEQIAMFLAVITRNKSNRAIQERFRHK